MGAVTSFRVLGPLEVAREDRVVPIPAGKQRAVLATLLLRRNRLVSIDELIERLWDVSVPADARATVQKHVMRLRRVLTASEPGQSDIGTEPGGYRLQILPGQLDMDLFDTLVEQAAVKAVERDASGESARLAEALALWRGVPPLSNVVSESLQQREVPPLVERYMQVLERRIEVDLSLGRHAALLGELIGLVRGFPLRERFWAQWMRALHGAGRQGEALEAYRDVARLLSDELGVDPGPELQAVHLQLLTEGEVVSLSTGPGEPILSEAGSMSNVEQPQPLRQLPMRSAGFVGRQKEIARITQVLEHAGGREAPSVVLITGPPGVGKTTLAMHAAHMAADRFSDGQLFADLRGHDSDTPLGVSEVLGRFLSVLGSSTPPLEVDEQVLAYRSLLAGRRVLIVLDNVGQVGDVRALLPGSPGCAVLVTSRNELAGLAVSPGVERIGMGMLSPQEGHQLLSEVLGSSRVLEDEAATGELVALCAGLTLALRVAATHLLLRPHIKVRDYLVQLRSQDRVAALSVDDDDRASLVAAFGWSYQQLRSDERRLFRLLGLIPGRDFAVSTVAALADVDEQRVVAGLESLAACSLLERESLQRYRLHDLTRAYAAQRCRTEDPEHDREKARRRLFDHYITTADAVVQPLITMSRLDRPTPPALQVDRDTALASLDADRSAMVAAVRDAARRGPSDAAYHLADALRGYFTLRGHTADWLTAVEAGLQAARQAASDEAIAAMLNSRGALNYYAGNTSQASDDLHAALEIYERLGVPASDAVRINLGNVAQVSGDLTSAVAHFEAAIAGYGRSGDAGLEQKARQNLVSALMDFGDLERAQQESKPLADQQNQAPNHISSGLLALLVQRTGDLRKAALMLEEAATAAEAYGDHRTEMGLLGELAACYLEIGRDDAAVQLAEAMLAEREDARNAPSWEIAIARALPMLGRAHEARSRYGHALLAARNARNHEQQCNALIGWAELELAAGDVGEALAKANEARNIAGEAMLRLQLIQAMLVLSGCHRQSALLEQATEVAVAAFELAKECRYPLGEAMSLSELAEIQSSAGDHDAANLLWQQAQRLFAGIGSRRAVQIGERTAAAENNLHGSPWPVG